MNRWIVCAFESCCIDVEIQSVRFLTNGSIRACGPMAYTKLQQAACIGPLAKKWHKTSLCNFVTSRKRHFIETWIPDLFLIAIWQLNFNADEIFWCWWMLMKKNHIIYSKGLFLQGDGTIVRELLSQRAAVHERGCAGVVMLGIWIVLFVCCLVCRSLANFWCEYVIIFLWNICRIALWDVWESNNIQINAMT